MEDLRLRLESHCLKTSDSVSMSQISPDFLPGIRVDCAALSSVERSMPSSTLLSLIVFMLVPITSMIWLALELACILFLFAVAADFLLRIEIMLTACHTMCRQDIL